MGMKEMAQRTLVEHFREKGYVDANCKANLPVQQIKTVLLKVYEKELGDFLKRKIKIDDLIVVCQMLDLKIIKKGTVTKKTRKEAPKQLRDQMFREGLAFEFKPKVKRTNINLSKRAERARIRFGNDYDFIISDEFLKSSAWRQVRYDVLRRDGARCRCCGRTPSEGVYVCVDHISPRKTNPELALNPKNLQVLCNECNHGKGNEDETSWR